MFAFFSDLFSSIWTAGGGLGTGLLGFLYNVFPFFG